MKETRMPWPVLRGALMKHVTIIGMRCLLAVALPWALGTKPISLPNGGSGQFSAA